MTDPLYLDYAATTPVRPEVRDAMAPYFDGDFGNPSSSHAWGRRAAAALERARARIADALGAKADEIIFVGGGTEADNLAILGCAAQARHQGVQARVITSAVEHKAVLDAGRAVARAGGELDVIPVDPRGELDAPGLARALDAGACLLSLMWVNNEVGLVQPIRWAVEQATPRGVPVHTDAVQAIGKVPVRVDEVGVALLSLTGHKIHGPKGIGALFVREGTTLSPLLYGGGQEKGLRPGTQDVAGAVGLAEAVALATREQEETAERLGRLRESLEGRLKASVPGLTVHAEQAPRAPHILSVGVSEVRSDSLLAALDLAGLAVSGGSACASGSHAVSHVLDALYPDAGPEATVRYSFGRETSAADIEHAAFVTTSVVGRLRAAAAGDAL